MRGDAPALEEELDDGRGEADLDALVQELVGDAVVVVVDGDVVVDVDASVGPLGELVPRGGQRFRSVCTSAGRPCVRSCSMKRSKSLRRTTTLPSSR
jgi:hypothetical protein